VGKGIAPTPWQIWSLTRLANRSSCQGEPELMTSTGKSNDYTARGWLSHSSLSRDHVELQRVAFVKRWLPALAKTTPRLHEVITRREGMRARALSHSQRLRVYALGHPFDVQSERMCDAERMPTPCKSHPQVLSCRGRSEIKCCSPSVVVPCSSVPRVTRSRGRFCRWFRFRFFNRRVNARSSLEASSC
jgi:hypothetical protein